MARRCTGISIDSVSIEGYQANRWRADNGYISTNDDAAEHLSVNDEQAHDVGRGNGIYEEKIS